MSIPKEKIIIVNDDIKLSIKVIKDKHIIYKKLVSTVPIKEDFSFLLNYYVFFKDKFYHLEVPQLVGILMELFGEPDTFYDDWKSSFNYTFDLWATLKKQSAVKEVKLVMTIFDCKESIYFEFRRKKLNDDDYELKFIENIIEREYLNRFIMILNNYFYGFYEGYGDNLYTEYEKINPYMGTKYGYRNGSFYCIEHVCD